MSSELPELTVRPLTAPPAVTIRVPGSKSITNRALVVAALANGESRLTGALLSDDTKVMVEGLQKVGIGVDQEENGTTIKIQGAGGRFPGREADLFVGNSGTTIRFLTAMLSTGVGRYRLDGTARMRERPIGDLLLALNRLGASARSEFGNNCPPVLLEASGLDGGYAEVRGDVSSQFLSGLLMALPIARSETVVDVLGNLVSKPYIKITTAVMSAFGKEISNRDYRKFSILPGSYRGRAYRIEPDASGASYFFAAAAVTGGAITIEGLGTTSIQGDLQFVEILQHMGCQVESTKDQTTVRGPDRLQGVDVDMNAISDTVMTLATVAIFADGPTRIRNVAHIRHKETDRIAALATELRKLGATVDEQPDGLAIFPPTKIKPSAIVTYDDHRMAMSFAIAGLRAEGITILDPHCVAKTYPGFWDDLNTLYGGR